MTLPTIPWVSEHKRLSTAIGVVIFVLAAFPIWIGPIWDLFSEEPLFPFFRKNVDVIGLPERRVGDVLAYIPPFIVLLLLLGIYVGSWRRPVPRREPLGVESDGMWWVWTPNWWRKVRAECPDHRVELRARGSDGGLFPIYQKVVGVYRSPGEPYCVVGNHVLHYTESRNYDDAETRATLKLQALIRQRAAAQG